MPRDPDCPLCLLYNTMLTKWHWVDETVIVCDCLTCSKAGAEDHIMIVLRRHAAEPNEQEAWCMQGAADRLGLEVTRKQGRTCGQHAHWHARPKQRENT